MRQYCGERGKTTNCQAGVFLAYASSRGYTLLHQAHCHNPPDVTFRAKPELGLLEAVRAF